MPTITPHRRKMARSQAHFRKAVERMPLGVGSNFRYWGDEGTMYVARGEGARVWDLDGNEYVDYRLGYGPTILGYCDPRVDEAARQGMSIGSVFALGTERELAVAERISRMVKAAELVRFSNSGTEAVMAALRLARGFTGKDAIAIVEGGYHGLFDSVMWGADVESWNGTGDPELVPYGEGIPKVVRQIVFPTPMNDATRLEDLLKAQSGRLAALLIEPIQGNCCAISAEPAFLKAARELCTRYGVLLIIDEVKTGFRVARGGVQELYGVDADLCTFAKAMGNGYPIAALAGREPIMRKLGRGVAHGGTYTAHAVSLGAAEKTLQILEETDALATIARTGEALRKGLSERLAARGIVHSFSGHPSMSGLFFAPSPPNNYRDWKRSDFGFYDALAPFVIDEGVIIEPDSREPWFLCEAHAREGVLADTLERFDRALDALARQQRPAAAE